MKCREFWIVTDPIAEDMFEAFTDSQDPREVTGETIHVREVDEAREAMIKELVAALDHIANGSCPICLTGDFIEHDLALAKEALARYREFEEKE